MARIDKEKTFVPLFSDPSVPKVIFDVGTYNCADGIALARLFPNTIVHAFEADPKNFRISVNRVKKLGMQDRVFVHNLAVGNEVGRTKFYTHPDGYRQKHRGAASLLAPDIELKRRIRSHINNVEIEVDVITIDAFCKEEGIEKIDILWCDANGADLHVLQGIGDIQVDVILAEIVYTPVYKKLPTKEDLLNYLTEELGHELIEVTKPGKIGGDVISKRVGM
jgi:FkbM family methyltransferase